MNTRERFGSYVLLKKLGEDPLGETFRAGRFGAQGIEQVVLLRVLNGLGMQNQLWQRISDRGDLQDILNSPNLGQGVDFGEIDGTPFVAYDYISGKDVASLLVQAQRQHTPVPMDHALLISERIALGLSNAYENRVRDSRVLHGFMVPHLVVISNEGETRSLGFEVAPGLRELAPSSPAMQELERYLSPETLSGQPLAKSDDVYSLGVILYELLTGEPYALGTGITFSQRVDSATLADTGEPLPAEITTLLKRSLAPREQRIGDVVTWHKAIGQLMNQLQQNPTTFNLAFFMHSLFRDDIEKETREIQVEKSIEPEAAVLPALANAEPEVGTETIFMPAAELDQTAPKKGGKGPLIALAAVLALLAVGGLAYFQLFAPNAQPDPAALEAASAPVEPPPPAGPSEDEILAKMAEMQQQLADNMEAKSDEMRDQLAREYQQRQNELERQLAEARSAVEAQKIEDEQEAVEEAARLQAEQEAQDEADRLALEAAKKAEEEENKTPPPPVDPTEPTRVAQVQQGAASNGTGSGSDTATSTPPPPVRTQQQKPAATTPPPQQVEEAPVRRGDLVEAGPGVVPPRTLEKANPRYPPAALRMKRQAIIVVKVLVDETGKVVDTQLVGDRAGMGLDDAAIVAAKRSTFHPATKRGTPVKMWHTLRFNFRL